MKSELSVNILNSLKMKLAAKRIPFAVITWLMLTQIKKELVKEYPEIEDKPRRLNQLIDSYFKSNNLKKPKFDSRRLGYDKEKFALFATRKSNMFGARVMFGDQLGLGMKSTAGTIQKCLLFLKNKSCLLMNKGVYVFSLTGLPEFDDACMTALLEVLAQDRARNVFSVNLGEKDKVSQKGWGELLTFITTGRCPIRYLYVDIIAHGLPGCKEKFIRKLKDGIKALRDNDIDPIWKKQSTLDNLRRDYPGNHSIDLLMAKPYYFFKGTYK